MDAQKETEKRVINLIIADESGSMSVIRDTTLAGLNETITTCQKMQEKFPTMEQCITLITFDSDHTKVITTTSQPCRPSHWGGKTIGREAAHRSMMP